MTKTKKELEAELESSKSNLPLKELSQDDLQKIKTALSDVVSDYLTNIEKKIEEKDNKTISEIIQDFALFFCVSRQSIQWRLHNLGLIR